MLLNIWRDLANKYKDKTPLLIVIGQRGWECENVIDMLDRCEVIQPYIRQFRYCDDKELIRLLSGASALLFPSFNEGFGIPLIEALSLGTPVIASNHNVFKEIAGDIPEYIDPNDGIGWKKMIMNYADSNYRNNQCKRIKNFNVPTWDDHFKKIDDFLSSL